MLAPTEHRGAIIRAPLALHYGAARKPLAWIVPDPQHGVMWRILWPNGELSDIANLARAKDAAAVIAERGPPKRDAKRFNWAAQGPLGELQGKPAHAFAPRGRYPPLARRNRLYGERAPSHHGSARATVPQGGIVVGNFPAKGDGFSHRGPWQRRGRVMSAARERLLIAAALRASRSRSAACATPRR